MSPEAAWQLADELLETSRLSSVSGEVLVVPVRSARRDYGWLVGLGFAGEGFLDREPELLAAYGGLAAAALDVVTAQEEAVQQRDTAEVLLSLARTLVPVQAESDVARITAEHALSVIGSDRATVLIYDEAAEGLRVSAHAGWPEHWHEPLAQLLVRPDDTAALGELLADPGSPRFYERHTVDPQTAAILDAFETSVMSVAPMSSDGRLLGVLIAAWTPDSPQPRPADGHLVRRLGGLADQATGSIERARLLERVRQQARSDELTGLINRRGLTERLEHVLADRRGAGSALVYLDLDRFKSVNDTLGHTGGDALLRRVGATLLSETAASWPSRSSVARLGGDEFVILLQDVAAAADVDGFTVGLSEALERDWDDEARRLGVRASLGSVLLQHDDVSGVLHDADASMYRAKRAGRPTLPRQDGAPSREVLPA
jgi:diguanylate cyclase (GGDEF)-like protein